jgi:hypothetical protein
MDAGGEKEDVEVGNVEKNSKMYWVATENDTEGAATHNFDVTAVDHGDVTIVGERGDNFEDVLGGHQE